MKQLLGKRIREIRMQRQLTQEQLAEKIGIGERNLSKIECGTNFVSATTLDKIVKALEVSPKELFDFEHLQKDSIKKEELIKSISNDTVDLELLYRIYQAIKK